MRADPFHVSANTDPKGDRSKRPQDQDPDMLLHVVRETDGGIVVGGRSTRLRRRIRIRRSSNRRLRTGATMSSRITRSASSSRWGGGMKHICRTGFAGREPAADYPLSNHFDEIDTLVIFDDVEIPWENVFFIATLAQRPISGRHCIATVLSLYAADAALADLLIGAALFNVRQTGLGKATSRCRRSWRNSPVTGRGSTPISWRQLRGRISPGGILMPNQSLLYTGRVLATSQLPAMMHIARELCGGQICAWSPRQPSLIV